MDATGKRKRQWLGHDLAVARQVIAVDIRPTVEPGNLYAAATTLGQALPQLIVREQTFRAGWSDWRTTASRLSRAMAPVQGLSLGELKPMGLQLYSRIMEHARTHQSWSANTHRKLRGELRKVVLSHLVELGWSDPLDLSLVRTPEPGRVTQDKPRATPSATHLAAFMRCEGIPLQDRVQELLLMDFASNRGADVIAMTWRDLGAPSFEVAVFGNTKRGGAPRPISYRRGDSWQPIRAWVIALWTKRGQPSLDAPAFPGRGGVVRKRMENGAQKRRKLYARAHGIALGWEENAGYGRNNRSPEAGRRSVPAPSEWPADLVRLLLGDAQFSRMDQHSTRRSFDTRLNRKRGLDRVTLAALTQHSAEVSFRHYDQGAHEAAQGLSIPEGFQLLPEGVVAPGPMGGPGHNVGQNQADRELAEDAQS